jgi:hypothetical protein
MYGVHQEEESNNDNRRWINRINFT